MRRNVMTIGLAAAATMAASLQIAPLRENESPPPEGARPRGRPSTGETHKPNGKRETERRLRQLALHAEGRAE